MGLSILLATAFNLIQLLVVYLLYIQHGGFFFQLTPLLSWSVLSGGLIAFLIHHSRQGLDQLFAKGIGTEWIPAGDRSNPPVARWIKPAALAAGLFGLILVLPGLIPQITILVGILIITRLRNLKTVIYAWPFFFYIAWLHLFRTDGVYIFKDWITRQGIDHFLFYSLRTTNLILCGQWLSRYIPFLLNNRRPNPYLEGMGFALPLLPTLFGLSLSMGRTFFRQLRRREFDNLLYPIITTLGSELKRVTKDIEIREIR